MSPAPVLRTRVLIAWIVGVVLFAFSAVLRTSAAEPGATDASESQHWSFRTLRSPAVPAVSDQSRRQNAVDAFIAAKLETKGLSLAPEADRTTLARRVYFDLLGLPPSPDDIDAFVEDDAPLAYERLLDRLLASPHFGERWGRHWLDNAGYVDVLGLDNDATIIKPMPGRWLYRDYVIAAFNADKPFDQFLLEQIAGDERFAWRDAADYTAEIEESLVATGFLRTAADDTSSLELNRRDVQQGVLERTLEVVVNNLLGLTVQCAKCHDHKYEPILQDDYYRMLALLQPAFNPDQWLQPEQRQIADVPATEKARIDRRNGELEAAIDPLRKQIDAVRKKREDHLFELKLAQLPKPLRADTRAALQAPADHRNAIQNYLVEKLGKLLTVSPEEVTQGLTADDQQQISEYSQQIRRLLDQKLEYGYWQAVYDVGPPTPTRLLERGDVQTPGKEVAPGFMQELLAHRSNGPSIAPVGNSSGRRLALARWLTDVQTPAGALAIRVRVNRIWQVLFGRGLVATTDNFGLSGEDPSHPELLEWLSTAFVADEQQLKPILRRILTSATYRQASVHEDAHAQQIDPDVTLLWKRRPKRLESEAVRDSLLAASGLLELSLGGPPVPVEPRPDGSFVVSEKDLPNPGSRYRRSLYLLARRNYHPTLLAVFDQPLLTTNCSARVPSAVVLQSLTMLNGAAVWEFAEALAQRIAAQAQSDHEWLPLAFQLSLGRKPTDSELERCNEAIAFERHFHQTADPPCSPEEARHKARVRLCHTLLNTSEFLLVP